MSCWDIAVVAAKTAVREPRVRHHVLNELILEYSGLRRMRRNIPATTIVELCSRAETGVGPSIAAGSQGCSPNWADFPAAAIRAPSSRRLSFAWFVLMDLISERDQDLNNVMAREKNRSRPMSPIRL